MLLRVQFVPYHGFHVIAVFFNEFCDHILLSIRGVFTEILRDLLGNME